MYMCSKCKNQISSEQTENGYSFPTYSVIGGLIGIFGATVTGTLLLIPATFVAGAITDSLIRRCDICSSEVPDDDPGYHLMEEFGDELSGQTYKPVGNSSSGTRQAPQQSDSQQLRQNIQPTQKVSENNHSDLLNTSEPFDNQQEQCEFVFDEIDGKLVQQQPSFQHATWYL